MCTATVLCGEGENTGEAKLHPSSLHVVGRMKIVARVSTSDLVNAHAEMGREGEVPNRLTWKE